MGCLIGRLAQSKKGLFSEGICLLSVPADTYKMQWRWWFWIQNKGEFWRYIWEQGEKIRIGWEHWFGRVAFTTEPRPSDRDVRERSIVFAVVALVRLLQMIIYNKYLANRFRALFHLNRTRLIITNNANVCYGRNMKQTSINWLRWRIIGIRIWDTGICSGTWLRIFVMISDSLTGLIEPYFYKIIYILSMAFRV